MNIVGEHFKEAKKNCSLSLRAGSNRERDAPTANLQLGDAPYRSPTNNHLSQEQKVLVGWVEGTRNPTL